MLHLAISANTLFVLDEALRIFHTQGKDAFDQHMKEQVDTPLPLGPLGPFIQALSKTGLVQISLYSRFSPTAGERIRRSLLAYGINVANQTYTNGTPVYIYARASRPHLFLSSDDDHTRDALQMGVPAASFFPVPGNNQAIDTLRIAVDFDGFIASHETDIYVHDYGLDAAREYELKHQDVPMMPGAFMPMLLSLCGLRQQLKNDPSNIQLELAIVTARGEGESARMLNTLKFWNIHVDKILLMDGKPKGPAVQAFGAHVFFDDNPKNCHNVAQHNVPTFHAIHGITNKNYVHRNKMLRFTAAESERNQTLEKESEKQSSQNLPQRPF